MQKQNYVNKRRRQLEKQAREFAEYKTNFITCYRARYLNHSRT